MHAAQLSFIPLLIVSALAFLVPLVLAPVKRFGIPVVVGEIIAGIVFGQSGLNWIHDDTVLQVLSVFGFAYLMFLSGLEINFSEARTTRAAAARSQLTTNPFVVGAVMFTLSAGLSLAIGLTMVRFGVAHDPWIMAMVLTTTSLGVVAPVLKERSLTTSNFGQAILVSALLADFLTILFISAYVLLLGDGANTRVLLVLVLFAAFIGAWRIGTRFREHAPARRVMQALSTATAQIRIRGAFAIILVFMGLSDSLGVANILGAFLAGVIISLLSRNSGSMLREKLDAIGYGFLIPIFFIMVGVKFDLSALLASRSTLLMVPILIIAAYVVKLLPALIMRFGFNWRETLASGLLLSARLSFIVAVAQIGMEMGVISEAVDAAIILVAIVTCTVSPIAFSRMLPRKHQVGDKVFIIGSRPEAEGLVERLAGHDIQAVRIAGTEPDDRDRHTPEENRAMLLERLRAAGVTEAGTIVVMSQNATQTIKIARLARDVFNTRNVIAWVEHPADNAQLRDTGVRIVNPQYSTLLMLEGLVINPAALSGSSDPDAQQEVRVVKLQNPSLVGHAIRDLGLPDSVRILRVDRGNNALVPELSTEIQANDTLTLSGEKTEVDLCARLFARR